MKARGLCNGRLRIDVQIRNKTTFNRRVTGAYSQQFPSYQRIIGVFLRFVCDQTAR